MLFKWQYALVCVHIKAFWGEVQRCRNIWLYKVERGMNFYFLFFCCFFFSIVGLLVQMTLTCKSRNIQLETYAFQTKTIKKNAKIKEALLHLSFTLHSPLQPSLSYCCMHKVWTPAAVASVVGRIQVYYSGQGQHAHSLIYSLTATTVAALKCCLWL